MCRYPPSTIYRYLDLPYTKNPNNTTQIPTYTTATQIQHSPCSHRIGKAQTQSSHPLTPLSSNSNTARAKDIHISHTPPTPLIPNTSTALDTIPKLRLPSIYSCPALTTPPPPSHPHSLSIHTCNTNNSTRIRHRNHHRNPSVEMRQISSYWST